MSTTENPQEVSYDGNCHCAAIKYRVKLPPLESTSIVNCNCSICTKNGYFNVYPKKKDLEFLRGEDKLKSYTFGNKKCAHKFCPDCGSSLFVDPHMDDDDMIVVNIRMIKGVDLDKLEYRKYDGMAKLSPPYDPS